MVELLAALMEEGIWGKNSEEKQKIALSMYNKRNIGIFTKFKRLRGKL